MVIRILNNPEYNKTDSIFEVLEKKELPIQNFRSTQSFKYDGSNKGILRHTRPQRFNIQKLLEKDH